MLRNLLNIILLLFATPLCYCQENASLEETMAWIKGKLDNQLPHTSHYHFDLSILEYNGCECKYTSDHRIVLDGKASKIKERWEYSFSLKNLDSASSGGNKVTLNTIYDQRLITWKQIAINPPGETEISQVFYLQFFFDAKSDDIRSRIKKAFDHAIKLCGGGKKKEKF